jgi:hypothetical protein
LCGRDTQTWQSRLLSIKLSQPANRFIRAREVPRTASRCRRLLQRGANQPGARLLGVARVEAHELDRDNSAHPSRARSACAPSGGHSNRLPSRPHIPRAISRTTAGTCLGTGPTGEHAIAGAHSMHMDHALGQIDPYTHSAFSDNLVHGLSLSTYQIDDSYHTINLGASSPSRDRGKSPFAFQSDPAMAVR